MERYKIMQFLDGKIDATDFAEQVLAAQYEEIKRAEEVKRLQREDRERRLAERARQRQEADALRIARNEPTRKAAFLANYADRLARIRAQLTLEAEPEYLRYWLRLDSWTPMQAFVLFSGYSPKSLNFDGQAKLLRDHRGEFSNLVMLNGFDYCDPVVEDAIGASFLKDMKAEFERNVLYLFEIWATGTHLESRYHPSYYIEWAEQRHIKVRWMEWARKDGLMPWEAVATTQELDPRKEKGYLYLVGALATLYWEAKHADGEKLKQSDILAALEPYKDFYGMSGRTLSDKLRDGIKAVQSS